MVVAIVEVKRLISSMVEAILPIAPTASWVEP
jgi:hypothetical protein